MTTAFNPTTSSSPGPVALVNPGDSITAALFQALLALTNSIANHTHTWIDDYTLTS